MGEGQLSRDTQRQRDSRRDSEAQPRKREKKKGGGREKRERKRHSRGSWRNIRPRDVTSHFALLPLCLCVKTFQEEQGSDYLRAGSKIISV